MASFETLFQTFDGTGTLPTGWEVFNAPTTADVVSDQLRIVSRAADTGVQTSAVYDLTDSSVCFKIDLSTPDDVYIGLVKTAVETPVVWWRGFDWLPGRLVNNNSGNFGSVLGNGNGAHPWVRFRHSTAANALYWETSADGITYSAPFATQSPVTYDITACRFTILAASTMTPGQTVLIDQVGIAPAGAYTFRGQKAFDSVVTGSTGVTTTVQLELANGSPATGLTHLTAGLKAYFARTGAAATQITLQAQTLGGAWVDGGFVEIDAVNLPGLYRLDVSNAAFATGAAQVALSFTGTGLKTYTAVAWLVPSRQVFATVGPTPSRYLLRLTGPTVGSGQLLRRQLQVLSGAATHERVTIVDCASNGDLVLSPPLTVVPAEGDRVVIL